MHRERGDFVIGRETLRQMTSTAISLCSAASAEMRKDIEASRKRAEEMQRELKWSNYKLKEQLK